jgi:hypothetical protein
MQQSDIARFRREQALQEQAAHQALYSFASLANHTCITARMERGADRLFTLFAEGKHEEALRLWETTAWALEEGTCPIMPTNECIQSESQTERKSSL